MRKLLLCLAALALMLPLCRTAALADAIAWDMDPADYDVWVAAPDGGVNFRAGPGTEYAKLQEDMIPNGTKLHIDYVSGKWGETTYGDQTGWIALSQTSKQAPAAQSTAPSAASAATASPAPASASPSAAASASPTPGVTTAPSAAASASTTDVASPARVLGGSGVLLIALLVVAVVVLAIVLIVVIRKKNNNGK